MVTDGDTDRFLSSKLCLPLPLLYCLYHHLSLFWHFLLYLSFPLSIFPTTITLTLFLSFSLPHPPSLFLSIPLSAGRMFPPRQAGVPQMQGGGIGGISGAGSVPPSSGLMGRTNFLRRSANSKTSKTAASSVPTGANHQPQNSQNYANYQNCTIVRSHLPHANYGTYVAVAPKILIFPIFVQVRL